MNKEKNFISAVIYIHNAENKIDNFLRAIISKLEENFEHSEIICVNDYSEDNSQSAIKVASDAATSTSITVINMSYFHGLEIAMGAGVDLAIGDYVYEFDNVNLNYDANEILKLYQYSLNGFDIVSASPDLKDKLTSKMFYNVFSKATHVTYRIGTENFRILSRRAINRIHSTNKSVPYRRAAYQNSGLKILNIKYITQYTDAGAVDKREQKYRITLAVNSLVMFTDLGYRFSISMTIIMMFISISMFVYSLSIYFMAHPIAGWTTIILFLSVAFCGLFGVLTIAIKYLQLLVDLVFKRKQYSFESIEKIK